MCFLSLLCVLVLVVSILNNLALCDEWSSVVELVREPYLSGNFDTAKQHAETAATAEERIGNVAVFLLGSMKAAFELGVVPPVNSASSKRHTSFFGRVFAAKYTWGRHLNHLYMVTGSGNDELQVLSNQKHCQNITKKVVGINTEYSFGDGRYDRYDDNLMSYHMFECRPSENLLAITVLHFPQCSSEGWGPGGPCCRCQNSMRYFLLARRAAFRRHHLHGHQNHNDQKQHFPEWMIFADDDYFMRMKMLETVLARKETPPHMPFSLVPWATQDLPMHRFKQQFGGSLHNAKCTVPCIHRFHWMGWGGFSFGALERMVHTHSHSYTHAHTHTHV